MRLIKRRQRVGSAVNKANTFRVIPHFFVIFIYLLFTYYLLCIEVIVCGGAVLDCIISIIVAYILSSSILIEKAKYQ